MESVSLFGSMMLTGLSAGLFVGWAVSVIPGTRRVSDRTYIETMQRINVAIVNPPFLVIFMGTVAMLVVTAIVLFAGDQARRAWWVIASVGTYLIGMLGVTVGGNIPLNNELDAFVLAGADENERNRTRVAYEGPWNRWHYVRSIAGTLAFAFVSVAALTEPD